LRQGATGVLGCAARAGALMARLRSAAPGRGSQTPRSVGALRLGLRVL